jgi:hypothetical protein
MNRGFQLEVSSPHLGLEANSARFHFVVLPLLVSGHLALEVGFELANSIQYLDHL